MLVTSIFSSLSRDVFYSIIDRNHNSCYIQFFVCRCFQFGLIQNFVVWYGCNITQIRLFYIVSEEDSSKQTEMTQRVLHMRKVCSEYPKRRHVVANIGKAVRLFYTADKYNFSYCRVAKVGSTFWTQIFLTLTGNVQSPDQDAFKLTRDNAHEQIKEQTDMLMNLEDPRIHSSRSFMVARNPYSRLFSSYIDQIYLPNKWKKAAEMVTGKRRQKCGSDVTFNEFLDAISNGILAGEKTDLHWTPIFSICLPCETQVNYLSKHETFNEDVEFILREVGVGKDIIKRVNKASETVSVDKAIESLVHTYVSKGHDIEPGCITEHELAAKIWQAFKYQGHIHNDIPFPSHLFHRVKSEDLEKVLTETLIKHAAKKPLTASGRDAQRQAWKVKFWKQVSPKTLDKMQDAFFEDFYVFQYSLDPSTM